MFSQLDANVQSSNDPLCDVAIISWIQHAMTARSIDAAHWRLSNP